jgi:hypothetical protein
MNELGFSDDAPINGLFGEVSSADIVAKLLALQTQYNDSEKDLSVRVNKVEGLRQGEQQTTIEQS